MNFPNKRGESTEHKLLKTISKRTLEMEGYDVHTEARVGGSIVDVLGKNENHIVIVECEAFREHQKRNLKARFREALFSFPRVKRILCMPQFVNLEEIWMIDPDSGKLIRYLSEKR